MSNERTYGNASDIIDEILNQHTDGLCMCRVGRVESYDEVTRRATVQPLYKETIVDDLGERTEAVPVINNVPVAMVGCGDIAIALPVQKGDTVILLFADHSLDRLLAKTYDGGLVDPVASRDPGADRSHHIADAIAFPIAGKRAFGSAAAAVNITRTAEVHIGGDQPLVTRAEFLGHTHATAGTGAPSPPIAGASGSVVTFPGTPKLRG